MSVLRQLSSVCVMLCGVFWGAASSAESPAEEPKPEEVRVGFGLKYLGAADGLTLSAGQVIVPVELGRLRLEPGVSLGWREGQREGLLSFSGSLGVHWLIALNPWMRGYAGVFSGYSRQTYDGLGGAGSREALSSFQVGPVVGLEARLVEGLYLGVEQQLIYRDGLGDDAVGGLGGLGGLAQVSTLMTRSTLALRWLF